MANDTEQWLTSLESAMVELAQSQTQTGQRIDEFISQTARLLGDHGSRLSRTEAQIESLLAVFQAADRRLNRLEAWSAAFDQRMLQLESMTLSNTEAIGRNTSDLGTLRGIVQGNEERFRQLAESQRQVMSRMDDLIAVVRERL